MTIPTSGIWETDPKTYHAYDGAHSNSRLKEFAASIPTFRGLQTGEVPPQKETDALAIGSALHKLVLEGEKAYKKTVLFGPNCEKRSNADKATWAEFYESVKAREGEAIVLTPAQDTLVREMAKAVSQNPTAAAQLAIPGHTEISLLWTHAASGLPLKARLDRLVPEYEGRPLVIDLKTAIDPTPNAFQRAAIERGYDMQMAMYANAVETVFGQIPRFQFIAVGKNPPYETIVYEMDEGFWRIGQYKVEMLLLELADRIETDFWGTRWDGVQTLKAPGWAIQRAKAQL
jgi:exodeoxyribonuclease VIII